MSDVRSKYCVFVSHCLLAQCVMADGIVKRFPGPVKPVLQFCLDHDVNIMQMPCPESLCASGGLGRKPRGKAWYEAHGLRDTSREIATGQAEYMLRLQQSGFVILGMIGVEFSPACAVNYLNKGQRITRGEGIYVEELKTAMRERGLDVPLIGIAQRWHKKMERDLLELFGRITEGTVATRQEGPNESGDGIDGDAQRPEIGLRG